MNNRMKIQMLILVFLLSAGCAGSSGGVMFLKVHEDEFRTVKQDYPTERECPPDFVTLTKVKLVSYKEYLATQKEERVWAVMKRGDYIYFATRKKVDISLPYKGSKAQLLTVPVTTRYKARIPNGE